MSARTVASGSRPYMPNLATLLRIWGSQCIYCGRTADTKDHVIPKSRGGTEHVWNTRPCCYRCNGAKDDATPLEWLGPRCPPYLAEFSTPWPRKGPHRSRPPRGMHPPHDPTLQPGVVLSPQCFPPHTTLCPTCGQPAAAISEPATGQGEPS